MYPMNETTRVNILDQIYSLRSPSGGEHIRQIAQLVDERMRRISSHSTTFDVSRIAVLAALNIADELHSLKSHYEELLRGEVRQAESSTGALLGPAAAGDSQSWFEAIFDADVPVKSRDERLSSRIAARLQSRREEDADSPAALAASE